MIAKSSILPLSVLASLVLMSHAAAVEGAVDGSIDLTEPDNYANQPVPDYITRENTPQGNDVTDLGATLGRVLFYDKRLSRNDTVSCASCHQQEHAFSDPAVASLGVAGTTGRHSMRIINARFSNERRFFWDERANTLEDQTTDPIHDATEMGFSGQGGDPPFSALITKLAGIEEYQVMFTAVYGDGGITENRMELALAQFMRSIQSFDSKYDVGRSFVDNDGAPFPNFTAAENAGKQVFLAPPGGGGAGCAGCHQPPGFDIDPRSGNNGVTGTFGTAMDISVTRSPTLRDMVDANGVPHGGFMHNAQFATVAEVIDHYNAAIPDNALLDNRLRRPPLNLSPGQKANLESFLRSLTGSNVYTDPKWSDPFDQNGELSVVVLPTNGLEVTFDGVGEDREATIGMAQAVPNVEYVFQWSHDLDGWNSSPATADVLGRVEVKIQAPVSEGQCFYRLAYLVSE